MAGLDELQDLLNTLVSRVTEEFVTAIRGRAASYFFARSDKETLYYKERIAERIREEYGGELAARPAGTSSRRPGAWTIENPHFLRKEGARIHWTSRIIVAAEALRAEPYYPAPEHGWASSTTSMPSIPGSSYGYSGVPQVSLGPIGPTGATTGGSSLPQLSDVVRPLSSPDISVLGSSPAAVQPWGSPARLGPTSPASLYQREVLAYTGASAFEVHWSVSVATTKRFTAAKVEAIRFLGTSWTPVAT